MLLKEREYIQKPKCQIWHELNVAPVSSNEEDKQVERQHVKDKETSRLRREEKRNKMPTKRIVQKSRINW